MNHIVSGRLRYRIHGRGPREMLLDPERPGARGTRGDASGRPRRSGALLRGASPQSPDTAGQSPTSRTSRTNPDKTG
ncbi:hypothetical protein [Sorangium sp. So ce542]|uniref:hypothetical protein n=1 Tax=Sorangium sp. So ce542 TaxID=3133316 RepID=UPI003F602A1F